MTGFSLGELVELRVKQIISEQFNIKLEEISDESNIKEDLPADSLDIINLICTLEEEFNIEVSDEDIYTFQTVSDIINYISSFQSSIIDRNGVSKAKPLQN